MIEFLWETASNVSFEASFEKVQDRKRMRERKEEVKSTKVCKTSYETSGCFLNWCYVVCIIR
jgi:hypothetical protein